MSEGGGAYCPLDGLCVEGPCKLLDCGNDGRDIGTGTRLIGGLSAMAAKRASGGAMPEKTSTGIRRVWTVSSGYIH